VKLLLTDLISATLFNSRGLIPGEIKVKWYKICTNQRIDASTDDRMTGKVVAKCFRAEQKPSTVLRALYIWETGILISKLRRARRGTNLEQL
jgi:hypothetical protein